LLPVKEISKPGNHKCQHQRYGKGCVIYGSREMPWSCKVWTCRWLTNDDTADLSRPDRSRYVIDVVPDFVRHKTDDGVETAIPVIQVWCDPRFRDAHRDPALRAYVQRRAKEGVAALIRHSSTDAFLLVAPHFGDNADWLELHSAMRDKEHSAEEVAAAIGGVVIHLEEDRP
jgi:hypothetical protein